MKYTPSNYSVSFDAKDYIFEGEEVILSGFAASPKNENRSQYVLTTRKIIHVRASQLDIIPISRISSICVESFYVSFYSSDGQRIFINYNPTTSQIDQINNFIKAVAMMIGRQ